MTETKGTVLITNADELINFSKSEEESMEKLVKPLAESGVTCVVSGGKIGELALHMLDKYKVCLFALICFLSCMFLEPTTVIYKETLKENGLVKVLLGVPSEISPSSCSTSLLIGHTYTFFPLSSLLIYFYAFSGLMDGVLYVRTYSTSVCQ